MGRHYSNSFKVKKCWESRLPFPFFLYLNLTNLELKRLTARIGVSSHGFSGMFQCPAALWQPAYNWKLICQCLSWAQWKQTVGRVNIIDLKLTFYWPCYPRQCIRMNEAFPIPTQLSANSICFEKCNLIIQRNSHVPPLCLVCYRSCKNADSILLGTKSHLALSLCPSHKPSSQCNLPARTPLIRAPCLFIIPHSALWFSEHTGWSQRILRSCLKSGWFSVKLRNCERNVGHFGTPLVPGFQAVVQVQAAFRPLSQLEIEKGTV